LRGKKEKTPSSRGNPFKERGDIYPDEERNLVIEKKEI